jgi:cyclopropane fatty-acyl-phospholipid synthase-like methyltransferase
MEQATTQNYRKRDYWIVENAQYAKPSFRLSKCSRMINEMANGRECSLLDVGCGPGALRPLLSPNISYYGIDIAIPQPASYLRELDFAKNEISFDGRRFDFVVALGVFEYMGQLQERKFEEIRNLLNRGGKFVLSYINFGHYRQRVWPNYNNVQPVAAMKQSLQQTFHIDRCFPACHHWRQRQPGKYAIPGIQMHVNWNIPLVSRWLAVEYFFVCSGRR